MENFIKQYPGVVMAYAGVLSTLLTGIIAWAVTSTLQALKDDLKGIKADVKDQGRRLSKLEGACDARHGGGMKRG